jgi:transmembrane sensor
MKTPEHSRDAERREQEAAAWVVRSDRGLSASEQDELSAWLARDPGHGAALARYRRHWGRLDPLADWRPEHGMQPNPDLLAPPLRRRVRRAATLLAPLAAAVLGWMLWPDRSPPTLLPPPATLLAGAVTASQRVLDDGSVVELNRDADLAVVFTPGERRVVLRRGEAHFAVTRDEARPFVVQANGVDVRAVGTAFNVRLDPAALEVLVTEGSVDVRRAAMPPPAAGNDTESLPALNVAPPVAIPRLTARQRALIPLGSGSRAPEVAVLTQGEIERVLAWQHRRLDFNDVPLHEIVAEFNRRNVIQLVVVDPELAATRISAAFRSDNLAGFVRLLEAGFAVRAETRGDAEIVLRRAR